MRRLVAPLALAALLIPATAHATSFGELPSSALAGAGLCLHATGAPGELAHDTGDGPLELLGPGPGGFAPAGAAQVAGTDDGCAAVAAQPGGAAIAAGPDPGVEGASRILVATRAPGGAFSAPVAVADAPVWFPYEVVAALSARGDAVVAWSELRGSRSRVRAVVRPAGGAFGAPVVLARGRTLAGLTAGMSAGGDAVLVWETVTQGYQLPMPVQVHAAIAPAGGPFGAPRVVSEALDGGWARVAVAGDGRALVALPAPGEVRVAERPPGGTFGPAVTIAHPPGDAVPRAAVAAGAGGRAAIVWTTLPDGRAWLAIRAAPGAFHVVPLVRRPAPPHPPQLVEHRGDAAVSGLGDESPVAVALTPGGAVAAWLAPRRVSGLLATGVRTAFVPTAGPVQRSLLGGGLRDATGVVTYPAAGGAGVAWLESGEGLRGRLHAALPGAAPPADPPAPAVRVERPRRAQLGFRDPLALTVRCSAACDVRAHMHAGGDGELSLSRAGRGVLRVGWGEGPGSPVAAGRVRLRLLSGAPGAAHPAARTLSVRVRVSGAAPPRPYALRARRRPGDRIRVTWATRAADPGTTFGVFGLATRHGRPLVFNGARGSKGRRRFALALGHVRGVRFVELRAYARDGRPARPLVVRVAPVR